MSRGFLGEGWAFPIAPVTTGQIAAARDDEKIRQSIWIILTTAPGERVMQPDFGCGIHRMVFERIGEGTIGRVLSEVSRALVRWEPRIEVLQVDARPDALEPELLVISIDYLVRSTNSRFNLVYPFYVS